ncbi:MAG: GMC family oxidoreductase [Candidatus Komeilibacteria bacterium]|nr:GMC family oxidoreductase [Candidatus Komeilibacteria bacterium]
MFYKADTVTRNSTIHADICIIGAGAAGITLGLALKHPSRTICILESGNMQPDQKTQSLTELTTEGLPISEPSRARQFGGTTTVWTGRWKPHDPVDFEARPWVPNSGWPITYEDLLPYYNKAADLLSTPHVSDYELSQVESLNRKSSLPLLHNEIIRSSVFNWLAQRDWDWGKKYRGTFEKAENVKVFLEANVVNIATKPDGTAVDHVDVKTLSGNEFQLDANIFILATGGIENARLLLVSRDRHTNGLGNDHDQVGRYYMDHPKGVVGEVKPASTKMYLPAYWGVTEGDKQLRVGLSVSRAEQEKHKILNSYVLLEPVFPWSYNPGIPAAMAIAKALKHRTIPSDIVKQHVGNVFRNQHVLLRWFTSKLLLRVFNRQERIKKINLWNFMEQEPVPENRVTLDTKTDALGLPKAVLHWEIHDTDKRTMIVLHTLLREQLRQWGVGELASPLLDNPSGDWPITSDASHHMGTTRMGSDPRTSVVDKNCKVHGLSNLYIAGSSVFPASGYANPTCTITALAVRLAEHLKELMTKRI